MLEASQSNLTDQLRLEAVPVQTGYFSTQVISYLQWLTTLACEHPVRTVALIAIVASTSYINLLESNLFEPPATTSNAAGQPRFDAFLTGSKTLSAGPDTQWKWQNGDTELKSHDMVRPFKHVSIIVLMLHLATATGPHDLGFSRLDIRGHHGKHT